MEPGDARTILVVGAGSIGGAAALTLAASGAPYLLLADDTPVTEADLASQPALREGDVGVARARATARRLAQLYPGVPGEVVPAPGDDAVAALVSRARVVLEASGRASTAFALNDAAVSRGIPLVRAGVTGLSAQLMSVVPGTSGCLRCLFEAPPPPSAAAALPILGPLGTFAGALLGAEGLRLLQGAPGAHAGQVFGYEARSGYTRSVPLRRRAGCPACAATSATGLRTGAAA
jgi:molybdopterin/thiamine biosynthesis adenylyltransferase